MGSFDMLVEQTVSTSSALTTAVVAFQEVEGRWPANKEELASFAEDNDIAFNASKYSSMSFDPQPEGGLYIQFTLAPPNRGTGSLTLPSPDEIYE